MATDDRWELAHVHCDKLQDTVGPDELQVIVDGVVVFGGNAGGRIGKGDLDYLTGRSARFIDDASVQLVEVDAGSDNDELRTVTIDGSTDLGRGVLDREFTRNHAEYRPACEVVAA
ncbi:MAG TPA: hypothetical protein VIT65_08670 [Microlunatus sp.]